MYHKERELTHLPSDMFKQIQCVVFPGYILFSQKEITAQVDTLYVNFIVNMHISLFYQ